MFTQRKNDKLSRHGCLASVLGVTPEALSREVWLFAVPHDDDIALGGGLWLKAAVDAGVAVHCLAVTDGRMGYCSLDERDSIHEIRAAEFIASCRILGVPQERVHVLGFPDCALSRYLGRRPIAAGEVDAEKGTGYTGIQGALVKSLRAIRPTRLIVPSSSDYHPDHQIVSNEMMISIFHADGGVWPELGPATPVPEVYEMAIYCDFPAPPTLRLDADQASFQMKLDAIAAYRSQKQIGQLVAKVQAAGPIEYLREMHFSFYDPRTYHNLFA